MAFDLATAKPTGVSTGFDLSTAKPVQTADESLGATIKQGLGNAVAGAVRGAGSIGATILYPYDKAMDFVDQARGLPGATGEKRLTRNQERRRGMDEGLRLMGAEPDSLLYKGGKLAGEIAGTAGTGGATANVLGRVAPAFAAANPNLLSAIASSGMNAGGATGLANPLVRAAGGAISGGFSAGLVEPETATTGAAVGAALPGATKLLGMAGKAVGSSLRGGGVAPEVQALAARAQQLGIDIPADRLVNSKPLDAVASALNYVPFSGRAATEANMGKQLNQAASRLMGQESSNINQALRKAGEELGAKFDATLRSTGVKFDKELLDGVASVYNTAEKELGSDALKPIASQVEELIAKGQSGVIDGQAAYNIKRTLDRIGRGNTPTAYHALELKGVLMDALNRSLGPEGAQAFAQTRQQYGNMLALEKLAKNGVDGEISVARLANLKNINNQPLQELADIAAQFVKAREGQHGAMQRAVAGLGTASVAGPAALVGGAALGRATNTALNSNALRSLVMGQQPNALQILANPKLSQFAYRAAPVLAADQ